MTRVGLGKWHMCIYSLDVDSFPRGLAHVLAASHACESSEKISGDIWIRQTASRGEGALRVPFVSNVRRALLKNDVVQGEIGLKSRYQAELVKQPIRLNVFRND